MINSWWLVVVSFVYLIILVWHGRMSYRHGIWDGAFNHFLPIVKEEMMRYDSFRTKRIFEAEDAELMIKE